MQATTPLAPFTGYQKLAIFILAFTQFSVILDFMVMSPLGDMLMKSMSLRPSQFGLAVSAYAFSAGISGLLTAGFADRWDRKKLLLFFYTGFIIGTFFCSVANNYYSLLAARIITGLFGGVIGAISMAIVTDLFSLDQRGRVLSFVQMGFGASQVLGIPIGLYLANAWGWQSPFIMIGCLSLVVAVLIVWRMHPVTAHLKLQKDRSALTHLWHTVARREYRIGFGATALLSVGGFLMMPFGSAFAMNNLGVTYRQLPLLFMLSGLSTLIVMPLVGKLSDRVDKFRIFAFASVWSMVMVVLYTHLSASPFWLVVAFNIATMAGVMSRVVPSSALTSALPGLSDRGAYMSVSGSLQQIAGGIAAAVGGMIISQKDKFSPLEHYPTLGYVCVVVLLACMFMGYRVSMIVKKKSMAAQAQKKETTELAV